MPIAEPSSDPVPTAPRALIRVEVLPVERHPAAVYLSSLGSGSRRTMRQLTASSGAPGRSLFPSR
jgi:hypothetical protein